MSIVSDATVKLLARTYHTPLYIFDESTIRSKCKEIRSVISYPNFTIRYACKALTLQAILRIMLDEGMWIDASSINEVHRALRSGFNPDEIYYTGEGATAGIYRFLAEKGVLINCTSIDQIRLLGATAPGHYCSIRLNPGKGHGESDKTNTGGPSSKHGIYFDQIDAARSAARENGVRIIGLHSHIGSGSKPDEWRQWNKINDHVLSIAKSFGDELELVNLGGGLPVPYLPGEQPMDLQQWGAELSNSMTHFAADLGKNIRFFVEPGRFLVAESGLLIAEVQAVKSTPDVENVRGYNYVIVNTGLNHNIRPALYGSYHPIRFISNNTLDTDDIKDYVVAGYLCESGDVFTVDNTGKLAPRSFSAIRVGDLMVMSHVGAYSHAMKSEYNSMNYPASVLIDSAHRPRIIERRGTLDDLMRRELETYSEGRDIGM